MYWAKCLTEIRKTVKGAERPVNMDDNELEWDENEGWKLPAE
jgi:hypothetical protein